MSRRTIHGEGIDAPAVKRFLIYNDVLYMRTLSEDQERAISAILRWYTTDKAREPYVSLGGYAGTGKTTLLAVLRKELARVAPQLKVGFASYTGKASRVLRTKLIEEQAILAQDSVGTIHSLIYAPIVNSEQEIVGWNTKEALDRHLIIIDEASMVDETIWHHLLSYGVPLVVVGDHGQLPPIHGSFNLMENPQMRLEQIHRQASENPIIGLSIQAREHGLVRSSVYSDTVIKYNTAEPDSQEALHELLEHFTPNMLVLCGYNNTRIKLNKHIRAALGFESPHPMSGDRVICVRNNHKKHIFNGMIGTIQSLERVNNEWYRAQIAMDEEEGVYNGLIYAAQFDAATGTNFSDKRSLTLQGDLFDFGYALTVHKAQGSQAKKVVLFEERFAKMDNDQWKRWLYTGITRAEEELYIFGRDLDPSSPT